MATQMHKRTVVPLRSLPALGRSRDQTMMPPMEDAELVRSACDGLVWAKAELFRRHAGRLVGLLARLLGSHADAEDAVQDLFVTAFRTLHQLRAAEALGSWLTQLAVHQAHRHFRRRKLRAALGLDTAAQDATLERLADSSTPSEVRVELALLGAKLARLPTTVRMAWMLRHVEGHELIEVARLCDCSLATAKRRVAAAQARIAAHVAIGED